MKRDTDILDTLRTARATMRARSTERAKTSADLARARVSYDKSHKAFVDASKAYDSALSAAIEAFPDSSKL